MTIRFIGPFLFGGLLLTAASSSAALAAMPIVSLAPALVSTDVEKVVVVRRGGAVARPRVVVAPAPVVVVPRVATDPKPRKQGLQIKNIPTGPVDDVKGAGKPVKRIKVRPAYRWGPGGAIAKRS
jgi:hypothetical protein